MDHDDMNTLDDTLNGSNSTLPTHVYKGGEWVWLDGKWKRAQPGGIRQNALLEEEAAKLGLYPPGHKLRIDTPCRWEETKDGIIYPVFQCLVGVLSGKKGRLTFTEE